MPPNVQLQQRREATPSRVTPGQPMGRAELAEAVNDYLWRKHGQRRELDAHTIARYERGIVRWPNELYREAFRTVLGVTDTELGFVASRKRRQPDNHPDGTLSVNLFSPFDPGVIPTEYLGLTAHDHQPVSRVGWTEVEQVQNATRETASAENLHGGGWASLTARNQLGSCVRYLDGLAAPTIRRALLEAVGNLSGVAGYAAFDVGDYPLAERRFRLALWCADTAGSWELRASTLADMARKMAYIGNTDSALSLIELAQVRSDRLSATARAMLSALRAQFLASLGRTDEALTEVARSDEHFADRAPATDAPWLCYYDKAEHLGSTGKALIPVARARQRIELAAPRIREAVALQGSDYPRSRTFSLTRLATLTMQLDDPREAAVIGLQAAQQATAFHSERIQNELRVLAAAAAPRRRVSEVAELRYAIASSAPSGPAQ
ncbi:XRE family transcriptional regulator [Nocardia altamirensis]|uniref:XRE family transcriptional regulator n=1 Tax=Nocardia altamirensis TaxID=472158 RepID=UPI000B1A8732|nr:XRE family transcriptional regulator [Nocardia altamirensis]